MAFVQNESLRGGFSQPGSPLSAVPRPALILVVAFSFALMIVPVR